MSLVRARSIDVVSGADHPPNSAMVPPSGQGALFEGRCADVRRLRLVKLATHKLIKSLLFIRTAYMTKMMRAWCKANAYARSGQHEKAVHWFLQAYEILDAGPPWRSRLKGIDAGYMLAALFFLTLLLAMNA